MAATLLVGSPIAAALKVATAQDVAVPLTVFVIVPAPQVAPAVFTAVPSLHVFATVVTSVGAVPDG